MLKKAVGFAVACLLLAGAPSLGVCASDALSGKYNILTNGNAQIGPGTAQNGYQCQVGNGMATASIWGGTIVFADGKITSGPTTSYLFISMGATKCTFAFNVSGSYDVADRGDGRFQASGTMTIQGNSNVNSVQVACGDQFIVSKVEFGLDADPAKDRYTFITAGADSGSTYVEGQGRLVGCTAPILNFNTLGTLTKVGP